MLLQDIHHFSQKNALSLQFEPVLLPTSTTNFTKIASFVCKGTHYTARRSSSLVGWPAVSFRLVPAAGEADTQWVLFLYTAAFGVVKPAVNAACFTRPVGS